MRFSPFLFVVLFAVFSHTAAGDTLPPQTDAARLMEQAVRCREMGLEETIGSAQLLLRRILREYPSSPEAVQAREILKSLSRRPAAAPAAAGPEAAPIPEVDLWRLPHWRTPGKSSPVPAAELPEGTPVMNQC